MILSFVTPMSIVSSPTCIISIHLSLDIISLSRDLMYLLFFIESFEDKANFLYIHPIPINIATNTTIPNAACAIESIYSSSATSYL